MNYFMDSSRSRLNDWIGQLGTETPRRVVWEQYRHTDRGDPEYEYALFSRSGFTSAVEEGASDRDDLHLFTVDDVVGLITE